MTNEYPAAFVKSLLSQLNTTKWVLSLTASASVALIPTANMAPQGVIRFLISCVGLGSAVAAVKTRSELESLTRTAEDMDIIERKQLMSWYNRHLGTAATVSIAAPPTAPQAARADLVDYWLSQDKHLLIVAGTGGGKSTLIQALASSLGNGWAYQIYDRDCTVDDWSYLRSLSTTRLFESYSAIGQQMTWDLETIESRTEERKHKGNSWQTTPTLTVAEEMPALVGEIDDAGAWLAAHAKRGRRVKRFVAVVAQNDTLENLGLKGDAALRDSCFVRVYLGKEAVKRAKHIKMKP